jgi:hypothetical protein
MTRDAACDRKKKKVGVVVRAQFVERQSIVCNVDCHGSLSAGDDLIFMST